MRLFLQNVPGFLPGLAVALVLAILAARRLGRSLGVGPIIAGALVMTTGLVIAATLMPLHHAGGLGMTGIGSCDLSRVSLAPWDRLNVISDTTLNLVLFVPLGFTLGLFPRSRIKALLIVVVLLLPFAIEGLQLVVTVLDRACQSADVVDNITGLVLGLALGTIVRRLAAPWVDADPSIQDEAS